MTWSIDGAALESFLAALDPDRTRAAEQYERIRARLTKFFEWRGCVDPQDQTDRTIDRVARRLADGTPLTTADPYQYAYGVAVNVLKEYWRAPGRANVPLDLAGRSLGPVEDVEVARSRAHERQTHERRLECLEGCLAALAPENRELITRYHLDPVTDRSAGRRALAESFGIPLNALRIRVFRVRQALERCVVKCLTESVIRS